MFLPNALNPYVTKILIFIGGPLEVLKGHSFAEIFKSLILIISNFSDSKRSLVLAFDVLNCLPLDWSISIVPNSTIYQIFIHFIYFSSWQY